MEVLLLCETLIDMRFFEVQDVSLYFASSEIQVGLFQILDIREDGWCCVNYLVRDLEDDDVLKFYCESIEVISLKEIR